MASDTLELVLTVDHADKMLVKQLEVFQLGAELTDNSIDDLVFKAAIASVDIRRGLLEYILGPIQPQALSVSHSTSEPFIGELAKYGVTLMQLIAVFQKYGPQIKAALEAIKPILDMLKNFSPPSVTAPDSPDGLPPLPKL